MMTATQPKRGIADQGAIDEHTTHFCDATYRAAWYL